MPGEVIASPPRVAVVAVGIVSKSSGVAVLFVSETPEMHLAGFTLRCKYRSSVLLAFPCAFGEPQELLLAPHLYYQKVICAFYGPIVTDFPVSKLDRKVARVKPLIHLMGFLLVLPVLDRDRFFNIIDDAPKDQRPPGAEVSSVNVRPDSRLLANA